MAGGGVVSSGGGASSGGNGGSAASAAAPETDAASAGNTAAAASATSGSNGGTATGTLMAAPTTPTNAAPPPPTVNAEPVIGDEDPVENSREMKENGLSWKQRYQLKHRELFLSRQVETLPATHIRGKCSVTLLNETESLLSYLNKDVCCFFYLGVFF